MPDRARSFDVLTAAQAQALVAAPPYLDRNRLLVGAPTAEAPDPKADHWQGGGGLNAPMADARDEHGAEYNAALEAALVVEDCASDVVERKRNGLFGTPPVWTFEPDRDEDTQPDRLPDPDAEADDPAAAEAEGVTVTMRKWASRAGGARLTLLDVLKRWQDGLSYGGRSYLRLFVPPGRMTEVTERVVEVDTSGEAVEREETTMRLAVSTPEEALRHIYVEHLDADQAALHTDRSVMLDLGVVAFEPDPRPLAVGPTGPSADGQREEASVELTYLASDDEDAATVLRTIRGQNDERVELDLGGRLTLFEGRANPLLSESVVSNQRDLNTKRTMSAINSHKAGFPSLVFLDVEPPSEAVPDGEGGTVERPVDYVDGPGRTGFFVSTPRRDGSGMESGARSGSVTQLGPVDNQNLRHDAEVARFAIYRGAKQLHVLALTGANLSGEAMLQGQGEFVKDLDESAQLAADAGRWVLECAYSLACALAGVPERARRVRCSFECRPSAGPLAAAVRTAILAEYDKGLRSKETTMSLLGVTDIDAERERLRAEAEELTPAEQVRLERERLSVAADRVALQGSPDPEARARGIAAEINQNED